MRITSMLFCAALLVSLAGCGTTASGGTTEHREVPVSNGPTSADPSLLFEERVQAFSTDFLETQEGYYSVIPWNNGYYIFFCPRDGGSFVPLCGKPNCKHNDEDCNAWIGAGARTLGCFDGALYTLEDVTFDQNVVIGKRNLDGSDHRVFATVKAADYAGDPLNIAGDLKGFYRGKAYVMLATPESDEFIENQEDHWIAVDLTDGSQKEIAKDFFSERRSWMTPEFQNGKMLLDVQKDKHKPFLESEHTSAELDLETGTGTDVLMRDLGWYHITDSTLYYMDYSASGKPCFKEYDRQTGAVKDWDMPTEDTNVRVACDEDYVYVIPVVTRWTSGPGTLYVLSRDYLLVDQVELPEGQEILAITSDRIFTTDVFQKNNQDSVVYYMQKSQIGSGGIELVKVEIAFPNVK